LADTGVLMGPVVAAAAVRVCRCRAALRWGGTQGYVGGLGRHLVVVHRTQAGARAAGAALVEEGRHVFAQLRDFLADERRLRLGNGRPGGALLALPRPKQVAAAGGAAAYRLAPVAHAEFQEMLAGDRQGADEEDAGQPDQNGDED